MVTDGYWKWFFPKLPSIWYLIGLWFNIVKSSSHLITHRNCLHETISSLTHHLTNLVIYCLSKDISLLQERDSQKGWQKHSKTGKRKLELPSNLRTIFFFNSLDYFSYVLWVDLYLMQLLKELTGGFPSFLPTCYCRNLFCTHSHLWSSGSFWNIF